MIIFILLTLNYFELSRRILSLRYYAGNKNTFPFSN